MTTFPQVTPTLTDYNSQSVIFGANRIKIAPCERLRICLELDKVAYNADIMTNGSTGTFDTNYQGAFIAIRDVLPPTSENFLGATSAIVVQNDSTILKVQTDIRILDDWAGGNMYYIYEFVFRENGVFYQFRYPIELVVESYSSIIPLVSATQGSTDASGVVCLDNSEDVCLTFTPEPDKVLIPVFHIGSDTIEYNNLISNDLPQLTTDLVKSFDGSKLVIDTSKVTEDFCLKMISKNDGTGEPVEPVCIPLTVDLSTYTASCVNSQAFIVVNYTLQGLTDVDVSNVSITVSGTTLNFGTATDNASFQVSQGTRTIDILITLENGCIYMHRYNYTVDCNSTTPTNQTITL